MSTEAAFNALVNHLLGMETDYNIVAPDAPMLDLPRYWVQAMPTKADTFDLSGTADARVSMSVSVETVDAQFQEVDGVQVSTAAQRTAMIGELTARFKAGTPIPADGQNVWVFKPPEARGPVYSGGVKSVPVIIRAKTVY